MEVGNVDRLKARTALVTGASRGIGRAAALALAREGARVFVHYAQGRAAAEDTVAEIVRRGGQAQSVAADLATPSGSNDLAEQVREFTNSRLDVFVSNAGVALPTSLEQTTVEDFDRLFAVNTRAPFFLIQQLLPILFEGSSVIVNTSLTAHAVIEGRPAYAMSKGALETMVKHLAVALGPRGIRVNAVAPGIVDTEMSGFTKTEEGRAFTSDMQALKRVARPDDVAEVIAFLASDQARWITGDILRVDGGAKL